MLEVGNAMMVKTSVEDVLFEVVIYTYIFYKNLKQIWGPVPNEIKNTSEIFLETISFPVPNKNQTFL